MVDYWARTGLLRPSGREAAGRGSTRRYTFRDIVALLAIAKLREANCPLQKIRAAVRHLRAHCPEATTSESLARLTMLTDGKHVYMLTDEREVMEVVTRQLVWSVPIGRLILETNRRVEALPCRWVEELVLHGKAFHLVGERASDAEDVYVQCKELPGAIGSGVTPEEAFSKGREAVKSFVAFARSPGRIERSLGRVQVV